MQLHGKWQHPDVWVQMLSWGWIRLSSRSRRKSWRISATPLMTIYSLQQLLFRTGCFMLPKDNRYWSGDKQFYVYFFFPAHRITENDPENHGISNFHCSNVSIIIAIITLHIIVENLESKNVRNRLSTILPLTNHHALCISYYSPFMHNSSHF